MARRDLQKEAAVSREDEKGDSDSRLGAVPGIYLTLLIYLLFFSESYGRAAILPDAAIPL